MKITNLKKYATTFLTVCAVIFGLTTLANAAVKPELISKSANGSGGNADSRNFSVSADGRYVVFQSDATNLVGGVTDTNNGSDIFLRDTQTGTVRCLSCVSAANPTSTGNGLSTNPIITPDGRYVVFVSKASDLAGGIDINNDLDVFRFDTQSNERILISVTPSGAVTGNSYSGSPIDGRGYDISDDGRYIVFSSNASDLTNLSDTNNKSDVFLRDVLNNQTRIISRSVSGTAGNNASFDPTMSADGQYFAFTSSASDLLPPGIDNNVNYDVFVYDADAQQIRCASLSTRTDTVSTGSSGSVSAVISKDGSRVAYFTFANDITNIQIPFANPYTNIVVYDIGFRQNNLVTVNTAGNASGNGESGIGSIPNRSVSISDNGRYVAFESRANNLSLLNTPSGTYKIFRRDLTRGLTEVVSVDPAGTPATQNSSLNGRRGGSMSRDGRFITFSNFGNALTAENFPVAGIEVYVRDMQGGITTALSLNNAGTGLGNGDASSGSTAPVISANGKSVVFVSTSTDLTPTPTSNQFGNIFKSKIPTPQKAVSDFDGDGKTDFAVWRPSTGAWFVLPSAGNYIASTIVLGTSSDLLAPADFSGDGRTDYAVFRPSNGTWYIINSSTFAAQTVPFGQNGDLPVPADYDGDGKADIAVYRPSTGAWYRLNSSDGAFVANGWGTAGDKPAIGDFDGDGKSDLAVYRPSNGVWYIVNSSSNQYTIVGFGAAEDLVVPADYDGDGKTDIAVFRPSTSTWYRLNSSNGAFTATSWGASGDKPVPADYDGDGKADVTVYRNGVWYVIQSTNGQIGYGNFGDSTVLPLPNAFVR